ncbi:MAG: sodium:proton antiporter [Planctomycetota bacterium]
MTPFEVSWLTLGAGGGEAAFALAAAIALGVGAQWLASVLKVPSILLLLILGFAAGPGAALVRGEPLLNVDELTGPILLPLVGIAVAIILYEGGLTLRFRDLKGVGRTLTMLVSVGALITGVIGAFAAWWLLDLEVSLAVLLGALLTVTGPTVIGPLLNHIRPSGGVGPILRWEGIVIDPIGAIAAVLVLEAILTGNPGEAVDEVTLAIVKTLLIGGGLGLLSALMLMELIARFWIPERLQNPVSLTLVVLGYTLSNAVQAESGLLAATVMGIVMANQSRCDIRHILEFKENLSVLIISLLFIALSSRVNLEQLEALNWWGLLGFVATMIFVARPLSVAASSLGSALSFRERVFLSLMAPRGIVAAAVASVFALTLEQALGADGAPLVDGAGRIAPITFGVIVGTVLFYSIAAPIAARVLDVSDSDPQGVLFIGASRFARSIAGVLKAKGVRVLLIDSNRGNGNAARMEHLECVYGSVLDEYTFESLDLRGIGRAIALTPNAEVNTLSLQRCERVFGRAGIYTLPVRPEKQRKAAEEKAPAANSHGRRLFSNDVDLSTLERRASEGWVIKATTLSAEFGFGDFRRLYGPNALIMFVIDKEGVVTLVTPGKAPAAFAGQTVVALVDPDDLLPAFPMHDADPEIEERPDDA